MGRWKLGLVTIIGVATLSLGLAQAGTSNPGEQEAKQFYKGKTISWVVASRAGGATDLMTRIIARHLARETGAKVRIENRGSNAGMNWVYTKGSKDGLTLLCKSKPALLNNDLMKAPGVRYVAEKYLYISDIGPGANVFFVSAKSKYKTLDALRQAKGLKAGASSAKGALATNPAVAFKILGLDGKVITGYKGSKGVTRAVLTGEVDIIVIRGSALAAQVESGEFAALFSVANSRSKALPDVPTLAELGVKVPKELQDAHSTMARGGTAVAMPPGVPRNRVDYLRGIFVKMGQNKALQAEITRMAGVFVDFIPGKELQDYMTKMKANKKLGIQLDSILAQYTAVR